MSFTFDVTALDNVGKVRSRIGDTDSANIIFHDEEIQVFLADENSNIVHASALALEVMASSASLLSKMEKIGDYSVTGTKMAEMLLATAAKMREADPVVGYAEQSLSPENSNKIVWNRLLRSG
ncbi:hypothetical protein LCGC14_0630270 [marine sediment metagenome]|uniref:Uncharacterized protein n=1 Tax=marine sediment metagenome TaxID=412755 RepID=A0A0F9UAN0_9ZZZZ